MSDTEAMSGVHVAIAAGAVSALLLTALAVRGFGQPAFLRVLDGLLAIGFAGYAGYLYRTEDGVLVQYVFAVPVVALLLVWPAGRRHRARRFTAGLSPRPYADQNAATPLTPFPAPPPPLGSPGAYRPADDLPERPVSPGPGVTRPPMPSGLAGHHHAEPTMPGAYQPKPSGLAGHHPAPEPPARHAAPDGSSVDRPAGHNVTNWPVAGRHTAGHAEPQTTPFDYDTVREAESRLRQPAYLADLDHDEGRHRADDITQPPADWPPKEWPPPRR